MHLLESLCKIHAPSGNEEALKNFLLQYVYDNQSKWLVQPTIIEGEGFQDCLLLEFGKPTTAVFAHMDSIGFTVRYDNRLVLIGGPDLKTGYELVGQDSKGEIDCKLLIDEDTDYVVCDYHRQIERGTELVFKCNFRETNEFIQSCYLDNRLGIYAMLKLCETLENGIIVFSCWEEHGGGSVPYLAKYIYEKYKINKALVADITWVTEGVKPGNGVVISMRDMRLPRRSFLNKIISLAKDSNIPYQLEVEGSGGSDGKELQASPYPIDWCFVGASEDNVHTPDEIVHKKDIESMIEFYKYLMKNL